MTVDAPEKIKVMVVEDDRFIGQVLISDLTKGGYAVASTQNGAEALALAEKFLPDLITLDLVLPGLSGKEILAALKKSPSVQHVPVIVFTNLSSEIDKKEVMELGAARYMIKVATEFPELDKTIKALVPKATTPKA